VQGHGSRLRHGVSRVAVIYYYLPTFNSVENAKYGGGIPLFRVKHAMSLAQLGQLGTKFLNDIESGRDWLL
jgi:hypothetical protein